MTIKKKSQVKVINYVTTSHIRFSDFLHVPRAHTAPLHITPDLTKFNYRKNASQHQITPKMENKATKKENKQPDQLDNINSSIVRTI